MGQSKNNQGNALKAPVTLMHAFDWKRRNSYLDSGCARHMTDDKSMSCLTSKYGWYITCRDNQMVKLLVKTT